MLEEEAMLLEQNGWERITPVVRCPGFHPLTKVCVQDWPFHCSKVITGVLEHCATKSRIETGRWDTKNKGVILIPRE